MSNKKKNVIKVLGIMLLAIICVICGSMFGEYYNQRTQIDIPDNTPSQAEDDIFYYEGKPYLYKKNIKNILFLGIDNDAEMMDYEELGTAGQADCILLLSIDKEEKKTHLLQISRDSMTEIDLYDVNGEYYSSMEAQVANQYAYGDGKKSSCLMMKKTVSELLYELPIYGYFALDIAAISVLTDLLGGVELTIPEDYTEIDPAFVKGATITLNGRQAERYIRYRDTNVLGSNNLRMQRQVQFIPAFLANAMKKVEGNNKEFDFFYTAMSPYLVTDLTADELLEMMEYEWEIDKVTFVPGESKNGKKYEEFHINNCKLQEILVELFYIAK